MDASTRRIFEQAGVELPETDVACFERLRGLVSETNRRMNLTRLVEPHDFFTKHVLDSLLPFFTVPLLREAPAHLVVADLGSGAGFPGLAVARTHPAWDVALIERTQKKAAFLEDAIAELRLANAYVVPFDAREAPRRAPVLRRGCGLVLARAVGRIDEVTRAAAPLLGPRGLLLHYKGGGLEAGEVAEGARAARRAGLRQLEPVEYVLPPDQRRVAVLARRRR